MARLIILFSFAFSLSCLAAEILPSNRLPGGERWKRERVGVAGGIPERTTIYATLSALGGGLNDATNIQAYLNSCPSNQVVLLNSGNYWIASDITLENKDGRTLRGLGPSTVLVMTNSAQFNVRANSTVDDGGQIETKATPVTVYGPFTQGMTNFHFANLQENLPNYAGITNGYTFVLHQTNDYAMVENRGSEDTFTQQMRPGWNQNQVFEVYSIDPVTTNVTTTTPLYMTNWGVGTVQAYCWMYNYQGTHYDGTRMSGFENFKLINTNNTASPVFHFNGVSHCWVKGVEIDAPGSIAIQSLRSKNIEIRDCYIHHTQGGGGSTSYGFYPIISSDCLVENCVFYRVSTPIIPAAGSSGNVFGYNYCTNMIFYSDGNNWMAHSMQTHGSHPAMNLYEGNIGTGINFDFIHGSASHEMVFRNRWFGWDVNKVNDTFAVFVMATNRYMSFAGNQLGYSGWHVNYEWAVNESDPANSAKTIWRIGHTGNNSTSGQGDTNTVTTLIRAANYDTVTSTNSGIVLGGYSTNDLPNSYYYTSKPTWWGTFNGTNYTEPEWPAFDPTKGDTTAKLPGQLWFEGSLSQEPSPTGTRGIPLRGIRLHP